MTCTHHQPLLKLYRDDNGRQARKLLLPRLGTPTHDVMIGLSSYGLRSANE